MRNWCYSLVQLLSVCALASYSSGCASEANPVVDARKDSIREHDSLSHPNAVLFQVRERLSRTEVQVDNFCGVFLGPNSPWLLTAGHIAKRIQDVRSGEYFVHCSTPAGQETPARQTVDVLSVHFHPDYPAHIPVSEMSEWRNLRMKYKSEGDRYRIFVNEQERMRQREIIDLGLVKLSKGAKALSCEGVMHVELADGYDPLQPITYQVYGKHNPPELDGDYMNQNQPFLDAILATAATREMIGKNVRIQAASPQTLIPEIQILPREEFRRGKMPELLFENGDSGGPLLSTLSGQGRELLTLHGTIDSGLLTNIELLDRELYEESRISDLREQLGLPKASVVEIEEDAFELSIRQSMEPLAELVSGMDPTYRRQRRNYFLRADFIQRVDWEARGKDGIPIPLWIERTMREH